MSRRGGGHGGSFMQCASRENHASPAYTCCQLADFSTDRPATPMASDADVGHCQWRLNQRNVKLGVIGSIYGPVTPAFVFFDVLSLIQNIHSSRTMLPHHRHPECTHGQRVHIRDKYRRFHRNLDHPFAQALHGQPSPCEALPYPTRDQSP